MKPKKKSRVHVRFKPDAPIGAAAAEDDDFFLERCFIDTGNLDTLQNPASGKRIVVGRTGAGKSALLRRLSDIEQNVINIDPQDLAIRHISNSSILRTFSDLGVNLDTFYQSLWQHIFCIELIKERYGVSNKSTFQKALSKLQTTFMWDKKRQRAWSYLESWGEEDFWNDTETRALRMTSKIEDQLNGTIGTQLLPIASKLRASKGESYEVSEEIVSNAQKVVDAVKLKELHEVMDLLAEHVFSDDKKKYYIVIDDLDRNWVDNKIRYRLIRALVESIKRFKKLRSVKIIISLRRDLVDKVIEETRDSGFQEEKYEDLYFQLKWTDESLRKVVTSRINLMFERSYEKKNVEYKDIFPAKIGTEDSFRYILDRTQLRPRDVIQFVNKILDAAAGRTEISKKMITDAEVKYSEQRLRAVYDEWVDSYPILRRCTPLLLGPKSRFRLETIDFTRAQDTVLEAATFAASDTDTLTRVARMCIESRSILDITDCLPFLRETFSVFHKLGLVGLKLSSQSTIQWCLDAVGFIPPEAIDLETFVSIHPMYHRALGVAAPAD